MKKKRILCKYESNQRMIPMMTAFVVVASFAALATQVTHESVGSMASDRLLRVVGDRDLSTAVKVLYAHDYLRVEHSISKNGMEKLQILRDGKVIWSLSATNVRIGASFVMDEDQNALLAPGMDLDRNGSPDFLVETSIGGRMGGYEYLWLEWQGQKLVVRDHIITGAAAFHTATDITGDGRPELWIRDTSFLYWRAPRATSVAKDVIVSLSDDGFKVAHDLMSKPAITDGELAQIAVELRVEIQRMVIDHCVIKCVIEERSRLEKSIQYQRAIYTHAIGKDEDALIAFTSTTSHPAAESKTDLCTHDDGFTTLYTNLPPRLWDVMIELVYAGQEEAADSFLEAAWPDELDGKEVFRQDFWNTLNSSLFRKLPELCSP